MEKVQKIKEILIKLKEEPKNQTLRGEYCEILLSMSDKEITAYTPIWKAIQRKHNERG